MQNPCNDLLGEIFHDMSLIGLLIAVNIPLLWQVKKELSTLINKLILVDSLIALLNVPMILHTGFVFRFSCSFIRSNG